MDFDEIIQSLLMQIEELAVSLGRRFASAAREDGSLFLTNIKDDLIRWIDLLVQKKLTTDEFKSLLNGKKDLLDLVFLKNKGLALIKQNQFKESLLQIIVRTVIKSLPEIL